MGILALYQVSIVWYRCLRRTRASAVRNGQLMPVWAVLRASAHAVTCAGTGLPRQDAQFRFGPVYPDAVPGRKYPLYAPS